MKKFLVGLMAAMFVLVGCATLGGVEANKLSAEYYETVCDSKSWQTREAKLDVDLPVVEYYNSDVDENIEEFDVDVEWAWIDYCNSALSLKYVERVNGGEQCAIFLFPEQDFPVTLTENYRDVKPIDVLGVPCEKLESVLAQQINAGEQVWQE